MPPTLFYYAYSGDHSQYENMIKYLQSNQRSSDEFFSDNVSSPLLDLISTLHRVLRLIELRPKQNIIPTPFKLKRSFGEIRMKQS